MEKDHLPIKRAVKNLQINQRLKPWARFAIAASLCPCGGHMHK